MDENPYLPIEASEISAPPAARRGCRRGACIGLVIWVCLFIFASVVARIWGWTGAFVTVIWILSIPLFGVVRYLSIPGLNAYETPALYSVVMVTAALLSGPGLYALTGMFIERVIVGRRMGSALDSRPANPPRQRRSRE